MNTQAQTKEIVNSLNEMGIACDFMYPAHNSNKEETRYIILVHDFNLDKAKELYPNANIQVTN